VKEFVGQCRREWKRLGVPDPVADEMAAELAADLEEAAAEGVSAQDVLGGSLDAPAFAEAWAAERGVTRQRRSRRPLALAVGALLVAAVAAAIAILVTPSGTTTSALPFPPPTAGQAVWIAKTSSTGPPAVVVGPATAQASGTNEDADTAAWALLATGLAGLGLAGVSRMRAALP
jgi:hypothetical protein